MQNNCHVSAMGICIHRHLNIHSFIKVPKKKKIVLYLFLFYSVNNKGFSSAKHISTFDMFQYNEFIFLIFFLFKDLIIILIEALTNIILEFINGAQSNNKQF